MTALPIAYRTNVSPMLRAAIESIVGEHHTLARVLDWCQAQCPPQWIEAIVAQDEFTSDVIVRFDEQIYVYMIRPDLAVWRWLPSGASSYCTGIARRPPGTRVAAHLVAASRRAARARLCRVPCSRRFRYKRRIGLLRLLLHSTNWWLRSAARRNMSTWNARSTFA